MKGNLSIIANKFNQLVVIVLCSLLVSACDSKQEEEVIDLQDKVRSDYISTSDTSENKLLFGFDLRTSPQEDARQYLPFLAYLKRETGFEFEIYFTPENEQISDVLGQGKIQFAAVGAVSYINAHHKYGAKIIARGINAEGNANYKSYIVVAKNSKINKLADIKGKIFAFGSVSSTQGHLIPRILLEETNIKMSDLQSHQFTGSHQACADAVISKRAHACGLQDSLAERLASKGILKIIERSKAYPSSGIAAAATVSESVLNSVRNALIKFKPLKTHRAGLYRWERTEMPLGFTNATKHDYEPLEKWMRVFGILDANKDT